MKVTDFCKSYFNGFQDISNFKKNGIMTNLLGSVKIVSYCTVVIPLGFAALYGVASLPSLCGRLRKKVVLSSSDKNVNKKAAATLLNKNKPANPQSDEKIISSSSNKKSSKDTKGNQKTSSKVNESPTNLDSSSVPVPQMNESKTQNPTIPETTSSSIEQVPPKTITIPPKREFRPFTLSISKPNETDKTELTISSIEEMKNKAKELGQEVSKNHCSIELTINEPAQRVLFILELKDVANVIRQKTKKTFDVHPKITERKKEGNLEIIQFESGIIDEIQPQTFKDRNVWKGRRIYPNGKIETGVFRGYRFLNRRDSL